MHLFGRINSKLSGASLWNIFLVLFIIFAFFANALHESYPDEFDNILGGSYILRGSLPYSGFFTHHGPVPYFIAALVELFSGQSFVRFRLVYAAFLITVNLAIYLLLRKRVGIKETNFYPLFIAFLGIEATYYWFHMLLADNIAALAFLFIFALLMLKKIYGKKTELADVCLVSLFSAIGLYSSLTYLYVYFIVIFATLYLFFKDNLGKIRLFSINLFYPFGIIILPHLIFFIYLVATKSLPDYLYQNFTFNTQYYIYNYPRPAGAEFINPVRYAVLIYHWFFVNLYTVLLGVKSFDFAAPLNATLAIGNVGTIIFLILKKHYKLSLFVFLLIVFTNVRSNPLTSRETDYQSAVYVVISLFCIFLLLIQLFRSLNENLNHAKRTIFNALLLIVGVYLVFTTMYLVFKFNQKVVSKYMGNQALIYDRPNISPIINNLVSKDEYAWIGPFAFEDLFYMDAKIPSKYHILIYGIGVSPKIGKEQIENFTKNKPKVIYFDREFVYLGKSVESYAEPFLNFLDKNYIQLMDFRNGNIRYQSVAPVDSRIDIEKHLYIRRDDAEVTVSVLLDKNYIKTASVK